MGKEGGTTALYLLLTCAPQTNLLAHRKVSSTGDAFAREIPNGLSKVNWRVWVLKKFGYIWYPLAPCKLNNNMIWICFEAL